MLKTDFLQTLIKLLVVSRHILPPLFLHNQIKGHVIFQQQIFLVVIKPISLQKVIRSFRNFFRLAN